MRETRLLVLVSALLLDDSYGLCYAWPTRFTLIDRPSQALRTPCEGQPKKSLHRMAHGCNFGGGRPMTEKERFETQARSFEFYAGLIERAIGRG